MKNGELIEHRVELAAGFGKTPGIRVADGNRKVPQLPTP